MRWIDFSMRSAKNETRQSGPGPEQKHPLDQLGLELDDRTIDLRIQLADRLLELRVEPFTQTLISRNTRRQRDRDGVVDQVYPTRLSAREHVGLEQVVEAVGVRIVDEHAHAAPSRARAPAGDEGD